jgi:hypothetical protein
MNAELGDVVVSQVIHPAAPAAAAPIQVTAVTEDQTSTMQNVFVRQL